MVTSAWDVGRQIIEEELKGKQRADYGRQLIKLLSQRLTKEFGKGFSIDNLENMRRFYLIYSNSEKLFPKRRSDKSSACNLAFARKSSVLKLA